MPQHPDHPQAPAGECPIRQPLATRARGLVALLLPILLASCGGGGGSSDAPPEPQTYTLSGTVEPLALSRADIDTNDSATSIEQRNDTRATAQPLGNPGVAGGFVAAPDTDTRFGAAGDEWDMFVAELETGQQIVLQYPDPSVAELGLYLQEATGVLQDAVPAVGVRGELTAQSSGTYYIGVRAHAGQSGYLLRIEPASTSLRLQHNGPRAPRLSDAIVPGQMIVRARQGAGATGEDGVALASGVEPLATSAPGMQVLRGASDREQLWEIPAGTEIRTLGTRGITPLDARHQPFTWASPEQEARHHTLLAIAAMRGHPDVVDAAPNLFVQTQRLPNDPRHSFQWFHDNVDLPDAWDTTTGGTDDDPVIVAVVDTGVFLDHEDLQGQLLNGYDFVSDPERSSDGDGIDPDPDDPGDSTTPGESSWHGTHVAGTIAAATDNAIGIAGISWEARIMPIRVLGLGGGTTYDVLQGVRFAAGLPNDSGTTPARPADIINLSIGGGIYAEAEAALYRRIRDRGILITAASGNSGAPPVIYPAAYADVLAVGATDPLDQRAPYSSYGAELDLVAPGGDTRFDRTGDGYGDGIASTFVDDTSGTRESEYAFFQGTSMATAVVSGVLALGRAMNPELDTSTVRFLLDRGDLTAGPGTGGWEPETGWGLINAPMTISAAAEMAGQPLPPNLSVSPAQVDFGFTVNDLSLYLRNTGGGELAINDIDAPDWVSITPDTVDDRGLGLYRIRLLRERLAPGHHSGTVRVTSDSDGTQDIPVEARVSARDPAHDTVGRIAVHLLDAAGDRVATQGVERQDGAYPYRFEDVPPGEYRVIATTDMNGDDGVCQAMEACGADPDIAARAVVDLQDDRSGLDFAIGFHSTPTAP
ncbi:MAG: S8 family serine peptidase [Pseudomonadota bacterium]